MIGMSRRPNLVVARGVTWTWLFAVGAFGWPVGTRAQAPTESAAPTASDVRDRAIAERFAPIFHQGMVASRFSFITNFDFDGDWVGDNN